MSRFIVLWAFGLRRPTAARTGRAALLLSTGLTAIALGGLLAAPALATGPEVTIACSGANSCMAYGGGFTPSGTVVVQAATAGGVFSSSDLTASAPTLVCAAGGIKPVCHEVGGGDFGAPVPVDHGLACGATAPGTVSYTDSSSHIVVTKSVTFVGPCVATTTNLLLPASASAPTGWTAVTNPAGVTAGATTVTSGTITVTVNGVTFCSYTAGVTSGCTLANMPLGLDLVQASYSGTTVYGPSSSSGTVLVYQIQAPAVTTTAADNFWTYKANLNGKVDPWGAPTTYYFQYGPTTAYGSTFPVPSGSAGSGITNQTVSASIAARPYTVYHYRLVATNEDGTTYGADVGFITPALPPGARTDPATNITQTGATLHGWYAANGAPTKWHFDYGPTAGYGSQTLIHSTSGDSSGTPEATITGLQPGATYHYRLEATNVAGTTYGADAEFTTAGGSVSGPYGVSQVPMYNCLSDGDDAHFWAYDETAGGQWQSVGSQSVQSDDAGSCPGSGSSPVTFTPSDRHVYDLVAVDPGMDNCSGDDPTDYDCIAALVQVEGDPNGPQSPPFEVR